MELYPELPNDLQTELVFYFNPFEMQTQKDIENKYNKFNEKEKERYEIVWRKSLIEKYKNYPTKGLSQACYYHQIYLFNYFLKRGANGFCDCLVESARGGHRDLVDLFLSKTIHYINEAMGAAIEGGYRELVDYFISKGANGWDTAVKSAAKVNNRHYIDFFLNKDDSEDVWDYGLLGAAQGGHKDLIIEFINRGANMFDEALFYSVESSDIEIVKFFVDKVQHYPDHIEMYNDAMANAAAYGHKHLVDYFILLGANDWNLGLGGASMRDDYNLMNFFIDKGASNWDNVLIRSVATGNYNMINWALSKGTCNLSAALDLARDRNINDQILITFFEDKINTNDNESLLVI